MAYERPKRTVLLESGNPHRCTAVVFSRAHRPQSRIYDDPTLASLYRLVRAINEGAALGLITVTPYGWFWWEPAKPTKGD